VAISLSQQSLHRSSKFCGPNSRLRRHGGLTLWFRRLQPFSYLHTPQMLDILICPRYTGYVWAFIVMLAFLLPFLLLFGLRARNTRKVDELAGLTSLSPSVRKHPLLVLRALDDEASLALAAATIGNRLSRLLKWLSYKIWVLLRFLIASLVVFILVLIAINFFWPRDDFRAPAFMTRFFQPILDFSFDWGPAIGKCVMLAFFAFLFSPGAFNTAYGRELLLIFQGCEINSQSAPDSIDRQSEFQSESTPTNWGMIVTLHQAEEARRGLRHGLYDNPECTERIAGWLQSELASRGT
jgi:hypothetical protein